MSHQFKIGMNDKNRIILRLSSHRRTIKETDIINFVNLIGLYEPQFIDQEYAENHLGLIKTMSVPTSFLISIGMGLVAIKKQDIVETIIDKENMGRSLGSVGLEAAVKKPVIPGDTLRVTVEAWLDQITKLAQGIVNIKHVLENQKNEKVMVFTEKILLEAPI